MATYSDGKIIYGKGWFQNATGATGSYTIGADEIVEYTVHLIDGSSAVTNGVLVSLPSAIGSASKQFSGVAASGSIQLDTGTGGADWFLKLGNLVYGFSSAGASSDLIHVEFVIYRNISDT